MPPRQYTSEQEQYVIQHYANTQSSTIAKAIGVSVFCVYRIAEKHGIKKSQEFLNTEQSGRLSKMRVKGEAHRYLKGHTPWNKGKNMPVVGRMAETQFKKGNEPHNTKHDGYERISKDGYIEVRIRKGKFMFKHRYLWEQVNGPVPKGHCLVFKDGNKMNITIDNLEVITRSENMKRNTIHRYSEELKPIVKLIGKLKNKINEKQNRRPKKSPVRAA